MISGFERVSRPKINAATPRSITGPQLREHTRHCGLPAVSADDLEEGVLQYYHESLMAGSAVGRLRGAGDLLHGAGGDEYALGHERIARAEAWRR